MTFSTERRVEFRDTDAAGIVHFSAFFPMMEAAEHEMLRSLGISVLPAALEGTQAVTWPRVAASCNYLSAARFEDILRISVEVADIGRTSVQYRFRFSRAGEEDQSIAEGTMTVVCCRMPGPSSPTTVPSPHSGPASGGLEKTPIPDSIRALLAKHQ
jgi:YbgC/YbaW family acyl-CoA thioester hydrolase